jgi:hypothetical protein
MSCCEGDKKNISVKVPFVIIFLNGQKAAKGNILFDINLDSLYSLWQHGILGKKDLVISIVLWLQRFLDIYDHAKEPNRCIDE